eukprot:14320-Chlamydomonas_euryale.AAC.1
MHTPNTHARAPGTLKSRVWGSMCECIRVCACVWSRTTAHPPPVRAGPDWRRGPHHCRGLVNGAARRLRLRRCGARPDARAVARDHPAKGG